MVTGTTTGDQVLTADTSGIADADGLGASATSGSARATAARAGQRRRRRGKYTLGDADVGNVLRVTVSYTDGHGTAESLTSTQTAAIGNVNDAPTGGVVTGTTSQGDTLTRQHLADGRGQLPGHHHLHLEGRWRGGRQRHDLCW